MKRFDQINVIPFIDIMLVLLAIVLTTATFIVQGDIPVNLSQAESASTGQAPPETLYISIDRDGKVYLDDKPVTTEALSVALSQVSQTTPINVKVDALAPFDHFVRVVDQLNAMGLDRLSIATQGAR